MTMGGNLLTAPLSAIKQIGEQASASVQGLGSGLTRAASGTLDALAAGLPGLPGLPGAAARAPQFPTAQSLLPANLTQALGQVENLLIPPGLPRPSGLIPGVKPPVTEQPPAAEKPAPANGANSGAMASRRQVAERRGM